MPTYESLPATSKYFKGELYDRLVEDLRLSGKAKRTLCGYVRTVRKLAEFHQKPPHDIAESEVRRFLLHLIVELDFCALQPHRALEPTLNALTSQ